MFVFSPLFIRILSNRKKRETSAIWLTADPEKVPKSLETKLAPVDPDVCSSIMKLEIL